MPVFIADLDTLRARLRISAADTGDAAAVIDAALEEVRLGLYDALGDTLVNEIVAITPGDPATTADQLKRLRAEQCELLWACAILTHRLPLLFVQGASQGRKAWNEEGITRNAFHSEVQAIVDGLMSQVRAWIELLGGSISDSESTIRATTVGPEETPPQPGASIAPLSVQIGVL